MISNEICKRTKISFNNNNNNNAQIKTCTCTNENPSWKMRHINSYLIPDHLIPAKRSELMITKKKKKRKKNRKKKRKEKRNYRIVDFVVSADHNVKMKESEKGDEYLDLAWELRKQWYMRVTVIPITNGVLGMVSKVLERNQEDLEIRG